LDGGIWEVERRRESGSSRVRYGGERCRLGRGREGKWLGVGEGERMRGEE